MVNKIGHYEIVQELGRGGMGVVYKGFEPSLNRYVAIKTLSESLAHDPSIVERFMREARSMASLNDPHIIQIYFVGEEKGQPFFAMEFVEGESLSQRLKRQGRLPSMEASQILLQTAQGLTLAHDRGVIHRDIKPANLMITTRGLVKVADFGIALASHDVSKKLTGTGEFVGTPGYLSPEVCMGKVVDHRSDIFSLGIVYFEMLSGRMPFNDASPLGMMLEVVQAEIPDVRKLNAEVDGNVHAILQRMVAKDPEHRYADCHELIADLIAIGVNPAAAGATPRPGANTGAGSPVSVSGAVRTGAAAATPGMPSTPSLAAATLAHASLSTAKTLPSAAPETPAPAAAPPVIQQSTRKPVAQQGKPAPLWPIAAAAAVLFAGAGFAAWHFGDKLGLRAPASATTVATVEVAKPEPKTALSTATTTVSAAGTSTLATVDTSGSATVSNPPALPDSQGAVETPAEASTAVAVSASGSATTSSAVTDASAEALKKMEEMEQKLASQQAELDRKLAAVEAAAAKAEAAPVSTSATVAQGPGPRAGLNRLNERVSNVRPSQQVASNAATPFAGPSGRVLVVALGNPGAASAARSALSNALSNAGFLVADADFVPGVARLLGNREPDLPALARLAQNQGIDVVVAASIQVHGQQQLEFYGNTSTLLLSNMTVKAFAVRQSSTLTEFNGELQFTSLNVGDNTRELVNEYVGELVRKLAPYRASNKG